MIGMSIKYWSLLWMGIVIQGIHGQGFSIFYAAPFVLLLALPFFVDWIDAFEEREETVDPVEQVKSRYVQGEIGDLRLEQELEKVLN